MRVLLIDEELASLLESHTEQELEQLRNNLIADGRVLDPIIVWEGTDIIVDGMHRYPIAIEEGLEFTVVELPFRDRAHVKDWIIRHQLGRRNGDAFARSRWRAMIVEAVVKFRDGDVSKKKAIREVAEANHVTERQVRNDLAVSKVLSTLPLPAKMKIETGKIAATSASVMRLKDLPEPQLEQVTDILTHYEIKEGNVVFRSLDEVIEAVVEHQSNTETQPKVNQKLKQEVELLEKTFAQIPGQLDSVCERKKLQGSLWQQRIQAAFAAVVAIWREQWKKP